MADSARAHRLAKRILHIVASAIEREIKDPGLAYITITDTRVTGDLHDATVFYTVRGKNIADEPDTEAAAQALTRAKGQLRKIVGDQLSVRFTPTLTFELDTICTDGGIIGACPEAGCRAGKTAGNRYSGWGREPV